MLPVSFTKERNHTRLLSHDAEAVQHEINLLTRARNPPNLSPPPQNRAGRPLTAIQSWRKNVQDVLPRNLYVPES